MPATPIQPEESEMDNLDVGFRGHRTPHFSEEQQTLQRKTNHLKRMESDREENEGAGSTPKAGLLGGILDANAYATKKTIAQGMLDVALLTANASQLKYLLQVGPQHEFYYLMMTLISISIILQIAVGILFIAIGYLNVNEEKDQRAANILNNTITVAIFLIATVNIIISSFGMKSSDNVAPLHLLSNLQR